MMMICEIKERISPLSEHNIRESFYNLRTLAEDLIQLVSLN